MDPYRTPGKVAKDVACSLVGRAYAWVLRKRCRYLGHVLPGALPPEKVEHEGELYYEVNCSVCGRRVLIPEAMPIEGSPPYDPEAHSAMY